VKIRIIRVICVLSVFLHRHPRSISLYPL